jgi:hypothetical protein
MTHASSGPKQGNLPKRCETTQSLLKPAGHEACRLLRNTRRAKEMVLPCTRSCVTPSRTEYLIRKRYELLWVWQAFTVL